MIRVMSKKQSSGAVSHRPIGATSAVGVQDIGNHLHPKIGGHLRYVYCISDYERRRSVCENDVKS